MTFQLDQVEGGGSLEKTKNNPLMKLAALVMVVGGGINKHITG
jgi:hypothetical protein